MAAGSALTKTGRITQIVEPGITPRPYIKGSGWARKERSYIVEVKRPKSVRLYWPRVSALRLAPKSS